MVLLLVLVSGGVLLAAYRYDETQTQQQAHAYIERLTRTTLEAKAREALSIPMILGDVDLARAHALKLVEDDPQLSGIRLTLEGDNSLTVGQTNDAGFEVSIRGPASARDAVLLVPTNASPTRRYGTMALFPNDSATAVTLDQGVPRLPWAFVGVLTGALVLSLVLRRRLLHLGELASMVASGQFRELPRLYGRDEFAWTAKLLHEASEILLGQVETAHGRNAALLRDATLKGDRLERIREFASSLVAPISSGNVPQQALDALIDKTPATVGMLLTAGPQGSLKAEASVGITRALDDPNITSSLVQFDSVTSTRDLPPLAIDHPWMEGRHVPLEGVIGVSLVFHGHREGILVLASQAPWPEVEREFLADIAHPLAIALANRRTYKAVVAVVGELEQRNDELARQRDRLQVVDRLRAQFVANMSHELRTPLNAIMGYTELIADECFGPVNETQSQHLESVLEASNHLLNLVNQVLDLSRAEAGQLPLDASDCDLLAIVRETVQLLQPLCRERPYDATVEGRSVWINTDTERVQQIVNNLVSNAIKFTKQGHVSVSVLPTVDGGGQVIFEDTGIGIPPSHFELIFGEFQQVDGSSTRAHDGVGLGLAISRRLAHALGGDLTVQSDIGKGSTFTLTLPQSVGTYDAQPRESIPRAS